MQTAKKLVLIDEFDKEYKRLQRPADAVAKTGQSLQLSDTLLNSSIVAVTVSAALKDLAASAKPDRSNDSKV